MANVCNDHDAIPVCRVVCHSSYTMDFGSGVVSYDEELQPIVDQAIEWLADTMNRCLGFADEPQCLDAYVSDCRLVIYLLMQSDSGIRVKIGTTNWNGEVMFALVEDGEPVSRDDETKVLASWLIEELQDTQADLKALSDDFSWTMASHSGMLHHTGE